MGRRRRLYHRGDRHQLHRIRRLQHPRRRRPRRTHQCDRRLRGLRVLRRAPQGRRPDRDHHRHLDVRPRMCSPHLTAVADRFQGRGRHQRRPAHPHHARDEGRPRPAVRRRRGHSGRRLLPRHRRHRAHHARRLHHLDSDRRPHRHLSRRVLEQEPSGQGDHLPRRRDDRNPLDRRRSVRLRTVLHDRECAHARLSRNREDRLHRGRGAVRADDPDRRAQYGGDPPPGADGPA